MLSHPSICTTACSPIGSKRTLQVQIAQLEGPDETVFKVFHKMEMVLGNPVI
jgi:hypothetical protein